MVFLIIAISYVASAVIFYRWMAIKAVIQEEEPLYHGSEKTNEVNLKIYNNPLFTQEDKEDKIA